jgi:hypothetical protein
MKNTFLIIILGLFTVGCLDYAPLNPDSGDGVFYGYTSDWGCPSNPGHSYDNEESCEEYYCDVECYCFNPDECD